MEFGSNLVQVSAPKKHYCPSRKSTPWKVYHRGKLYWFPTEPEADTKIADIEKGQSAAPKLNNRDVDEVLYARELLKGTPLITAVRFYIEHNPTNMRATKTEEAVEDFKKTFKDLRDKTKIERVRNLRIFSDDFTGVTLNNISRLAIEAMLDDYESAHSYNALLKYVRQFFDWAVDKGLCAMNPTRKQGNKRPIAFRKTKATKVVLTLPDAAHVMKICRAEFPELEAAVGMQMYGGIRTEEIFRLDWKHVRDKSIFIPEDVAKMGNREGAARVIDWMPKALRTCLPKPKERPESGPIIPNWKRKKTALLRRCRETKEDFVWGQNAFRHTYATYGCAFWQSADRMKLLMGQRDADVFFTSYRRYATQAQGEKYFSEQSPKGKRLS